MDAPKITITSYEPRRGSAPLTVTAVYRQEPGSGAITELRWQYRRQGAGDAWIDAAVNPPGDPDHHYVFQEPGSYELRLRAVGPGGEDATALPRLVTVTGGGPEPEPPHTNDRLVYLRCADGTHRLSARIDRPRVPITAEATGDGPYEEFAVRVRDDGRVGFRATINNRWMSAEADGSLTCTREKPADYVPDAWEAFTLQAMGGDTVALKTDHGTWVSAEGGGGGRVIANRGEPQAWETFTPSVPLLSGAIGEIAADGPWLTLNGKLWFYRGLTAFLLSKRFLTGREDEARRYMDFAARERFNVLRVFSQVKWDGITSGFEEGFFAADYPNYDAVMRRMFEEAGQRGLTIEFVAHTFAAGTQQMVDHLRRCDDLARAHPNAMLECANEPPVNGIDIQGVLSRYRPAIRMWASGQYDPTPYPAGSYTTDHPPRDVEWPRKFKGSIELQTGEGPWTRFQPPYLGPCVLDEPIRVEDARAPDDWQAFGAGSRLFAAGATVHGGAWAQKCEVPADAALIACVRAFHQGIDAVPDQRYSGYGHPDDLDDPGAGVGHRRYRRNGEDGNTYEISVRPFRFGQV